MVFDLGPELFLGDGLGEVVVESAGTDALLVAGHGVGGHRDQRQTLQLRVGAQLPGHLVPVHAGQGDVEEHQVGPLPPGQFQPLLAVGGLDQLVAVFEQLDQQVGIHIHVYHDQKLLHGKAPAEWH